MDVVIAGAGVLGVSLAYHLSKYKLRVCVIEREAVPAAHASGKNAGMFRQLYNHPQLTDWAFRSRELWPDEIRDNCFQQTGSIISGRLAPKHHPRLFKQLEIDGTPLVYTNTDGLLDSGSYVERIAKSAKASNVEFLFRTKVESVSYQGNQWTVKCSDNRSIHSSVFVNAAGAWINHVLKPLCPGLQKQAEAFARHLFLVEGWQRDYMPAADCGYFWEEKRFFSRRLSDWRLYFIAEGFLAILFLTPSTQ